MNNNFKWYVLRLHAGNERKVVNYINQELTRTGYKEQVDEILLPIERYKVGDKIKEKNIFPGYSFVRLNWTQELNVILRDIPGVYGFLQEDFETSVTNSKGRKKVVSSEKMPVPVKDSEIQWLFKLQEKSDRTQVDDSLKSGDKVRLKQGPFSGFNGTILDVSGEKVRLNVTIFERDTMIETILEHIERIKLVEA